MNKIYLFFVFVLCYHISFSQKQIFDESNTNFKKTLEAKRSKEYDNYKLYSSYQVFNTNDETISIKVGNRNKSFSKEYSYKNQNGYLVWYGTNNGDEIILLQKDGRLTGYISSNEGEYNIMTIDENTILLGKVSSSTISGDCDTEPDLDNGSLNKKTTLVFDQSNIRKMYKLLFAYTPEFAAFYNFNQNQINDVLELIVERMNQTYITNQSRMEVRLAFSYMTPDSETGDKGGDLTLFQFPGISAGPSGPNIPGTFDEVFQYEELYNIEASVLLVNTDYGGRAARGARKAVASRWASINNFTAAHEVGHMLGLEHERSEFNWFERVIGGLDKKRAYGYVGNSSRSVMATYGNSQTRRALYSDPFFNFQEGDQSGNDHAKASYRIRVKPWNVVRKTDRLNENLNNITITNDQTYHTFAYNNIETSDYVVEPSARIRLTAANSIKLKSGTKLSNGSHSVVKIQQGPFETTVFNRSSNNLAEKSLDYETDEIEDVEDYYKIYSSGRKLANIDVSFPEKIEFTIEIIDILTGQKLVSEYQKASRESFIYDLSKSNSTYVAVSLIFDHNIIKSKKIKI